MHPRPPFEANSPTRAHLSTEPLESTSQITSHLTSLGETFSLSDDATPEPESFSKYYQCPVCSYCSSFSSGLERHMRSHTGEKPYACSLCPHRSALPENLKRHMQTHTGEKPHECPYCCRLFNRKSHVARHVSKIHGINEASPT